MADITGPVHDAMIDAGKTAAVSRLAWAVKMFLHAHGNDMAAIRAMHDVITDISTEMTMLSVQPKVLGVDIPFHGKGLVETINGAAAPDLFG